MMTHGSRYFTAIPPSHLQCRAGRGRSRPWTQVRDAGEERGGQGPVGGRQHGGQVLSLWGRSNWQKSSKILVLWCGFKKTSGFYGAVLGRNPVSTTENPQNIMGHETHLGKQSWLCSGSMKISEHWTSETQKHLMQKYSGCWWFWMKVGVGSFGRRPSWCESVAGSGERKHLPLRSVALIITEESMDGR